MSHASPSSDGQTPECLVILGLRPPLTLEDVKQAYMAKAMKAHPDRGGDPQEFIRLQKAFDDANEYVKFKASKIEWLASKIDAYAQQQEVATETIERGGSIEMEETDWLRRSFGDDFGHVADKLVAVRLANGRAARVPVGLAQGPGGTRPRGWPDHRRGAAAAQGAQEPAATRPAGHPSR
jgi:DnaJ-class molecular chaperone